MANALAARAGTFEAQRLLSTTSWTLQHLPASMVEEHEVTTLMRAVAERFPGEPGRVIARDAGLRTADYLLRVRIPWIARTLLVRLPARLALRLLLVAIARHAWTFAGSARFTTGRGTDGHATFALAGCPVCRGQRATEPACAYYAGTVERLVRRLVSVRAEVRELCCEAMGHEACTFLIDLAPVAAPAGRVSAPDGLR